MDDLISRQAAIDAFEDTVFTKNEIRRRLSELPSAQPERKKGKWIYSDDDGVIYDSYYCSCCHRYITVDAERKCDIGFVIDDFDFCPHCGADMRGEQNDQ